MGELGPVAKVPILTDTKCCFCLYSRWSGLNGLTDTMIKLSFQKTK